MKHQNNFLIKKKRIRPSLPRPTHHSQTTITPITHHGQTII